MTNAVKKTPPSTVLIDDTEDLDTILFKFNEVLRPAGVKLQEDGETHKGFRVFRVVYVCPFVD